MSDEIDFSFRKLVPPTMPALTIDLERLGKQPTGILIRCVGPTGAGTFDIADLDRYSLHCWLRSRGGENLWAENTVLLLLGHKPVIDKEFM